MTSTNTFSMIFPASLATAFIFAAACGSSPSTRAGAAGSSTGGTGTGGADTFGVGGSSGTPCTSDVDCNDDNSCTLDTCTHSGSVEVQTGACAHAPTPGVACDDGNPCTTGDTCTATGTCAGTGTCTDGGSDACSPTCAGLCAGAPDGCGGTCPTTSCDGCCNVSHGCVAYGSQTSVDCGGAGQTCISCPSGTECNPSAHVCKPPCAPSCAGKCPSAPDGCGGTCSANAACAGCCDAQGTCNAGAAAQSDAVCGANGGACADCTSAGEHCNTYAGASQCTPVCTGHFSAIIVANGNLGGIAGADALCATKLGAGWHAAIRPGYDNDLSSVCTGDWCLATQWNGVSSAMLGSCNGYTSSSSSEAANGYASRPQDGNLGCASWAGQVYCDGSLAPGEGSDWAPLGILCTNL